MNHSKHGLLMLICCLVPLAALTAIVVFNVPANNVLLVGVALLCPLLHLVMMGFMFRGGSERQIGHSHEHHIADAKRKDMPTLE
jgi:hypothetical protein